MSIMPGAVWRPITIPGGNPGARTKGRGVILHVAASEATSLFSFFNNNASANSHFYVNKAGVIEQYVDTDYQSWASMAANKNTITVETQGGVTNADAEPWTPAQVESLARICAWAHATEGVPLVPMTNSLPASRGIGYHRLGIDPWRIAGGEVWSGSRGKLCPGAAKIAQIPAVIAAAQGADMPLTPADLQAIHDAVWHGQGDTGQGKGVWIADRIIGVDQKTSDIGARLDALAVAVAKIPTSVAQLDPKAIAAPIIAAVQQAVAALPADQAQAVADLVLAGIGQRMNTPPAA